MERLGGTAPCPPASGRRRALDFAHRAAAKQRSGDADSAYHQRPGGEFRCNRQTGRARPGGAAIRCRDELLPADPVGAGLGGKAIRPSSGPMLRVGLTGFDSGARAERGRGRRGKGDEAKRNDGRTHISIESSGGGFEGEDLLLCRQIPARFSRAARTGVQGVSPSSSHQRRAPCEAARVARVPLMFGDQAPARLRSVIAGNSGGVWTRTLIGANDARYCCGVIPVARRNRQRKKATSL